MNAPLRIGVLGASRIADLAIHEATAKTGDIRAAVAARDPQRAAAFAEAHGYERAHASYDALIADDSLDLIYIGLPNAFHAEWAIRALEAGRHVLVEKPFASNLAEFDRVAAAMRASTGWAWEAFHQAHHPVMRGFLDALRSGEIGEVTDIEIRMDMPDPGDDDPRWSFDLAGGTLMDLGCYALHGLDAIADALGEEAGLLTAEAAPFRNDDRVDATVSAEYAIGAVPAHVHTTMLSDELDFRLQANGTRGSVVAPSFVRPHEDDRLLITVDGETRAEATGSWSSYALQLEAIRDRVRAGDRSETDLAVSRRVAARIDEVYRAAGFPLRAARVTA